MRQITSFTLFLALCAAGPAIRSTLAAETDLATTLAQVTSFDQNGAVRAKAFADILALGEEGIVKMADYLSSPGTPENAGARYAIHGIATRVCRTGAETERAAFVQTIAGLLGGDRPPAVKKFLIEQLQLAGREDAVPVLSQYLIGDPMLAESARQALEANRSDAAVEALRARLPTSGGPLRVGIINSLGKRRDARAVGALIADAKSPNEAIRCAALEALGRIGDARAEPAILAATASDSEAVKRAAFEGYLQLGERFTATLQPIDAGRVYTDLLQRAPEAHYRCAALYGIKKIGVIRSIEPILPYLGDGDAAVRKAASACLAGMPDANVLAALTKAMTNASPPIRAALLRVLAERKDPKADETIREATKDANAEVRIAAYELLGRLDDPAIEPVLLDAARKGSSRIRTIALVAYMKQADAKRAKGDGDAALAMFKRAFDLAEDDVDIMRQAIHGIGLVASVDSLAMIEPLLNDYALRGEASRAYVAISGTIAKSGDEERAKKMLWRVVEMGPPSDVRKAAGEQLRALGEDFDPAKAAGFVTTWWYVGPFAGPNIDKEFPPEHGIDLAAEVQVGDEKKRWKRHHTENEEGRVNLTSLMSPNNDVTGYLYAEVTVDKAQLIILKTGSDDEMKIWLNGEMVHRVASPRSLGVDQDSKKTRLKTGTNVILFKICNHGGGWEGCLRITDREGRAIPFKQKEK